MVYEYLRFGKAMDANAPLRRESGLVSLWVSLVLKGANPCSEPRDLQDPLESARLSLLQEDNSRWAESSQGLLFLSEDFRDCNV